MDKLRSYLRRRPSYQPLEGESQQHSSEDGKPRFSWIEYIIFLLLGIAMLWAWNMFLAANPYFQRRFASHKNLLDNFQAAETSVSTVANLGTMIVLTKLQANASYPGRIVTSLITLVVAFTLLAISTKAFGPVSGVGYFTFLMVMVFVSSIAVGFMQNGTFAFVSGFKRKEYMQGIMLGQAVAGVLPPIVQIVTVLSASEDEGGAGQQSSSSALAYFLTATGVSAGTLLAFTYLLKRHRTGRIKLQDDQDANDPAASSDEPHRSDGLKSDERRKSISFFYLFRKLWIRAIAVFITFAITMVFPVFTGRIVSANPDPPPWLQKAAFIPLGFLLWNAGDLLGRLVPLIPRLSLAAYPKVLLLISIARVVFIPLYYLCNFESAGTSIGASTTVQSDFFYLIVVQLLFGLTNGYNGSCCMMGANDEVEEDAYEAAGGFMGMMLVAGLAVGSLCSFFAG